MTVHDLRGPLDAEDTIPDEWLSERMRLIRDIELSSSDWTQTPDNPISNKAAWATYRQALRDFPATWTPSETLNLPDPPS